MHRVFAAALLLLATIVPARATGIEVAIAGVAAWYASIGVTGQLALKYVGTGR